MKVDLEKKEKTKRIQYSIFILDRWKMTKNYPGFNLLHLTFSDYRVMKSILNWEFFFFLQLTYNRTAKLTLIFSYGLSEDLSY